ncbi:uncharacterized protein KQ657_003147 [Scheffersomyces spartinae]|uniref:Ammonium transporter AmtB-like domain-containing protein n=1 Tax=Scheffersomyces spartinae TaxID=45513 RepID=A0A9P8AGD9_9ASCO|nr:uncharacterized protein KQ657_003147 [Scheffersomyces spartinae]KAG7191471.1 hypothetical protein KQ657_003147 [Scheffersomyces spartinae]
MSSPHMMSAYLTAKRADTEFATQTASLVPADMGYVLFSAFAVFLITPGIALFYGGVLKRKNMVQLMFQSYMTTCVIGMIWFLIGYSLAGSPTSTSKLIGNLKMAALHDTEAYPVVAGGTIPSIVNYCFNVFFPIATVQIFIGAIGERGKLVPSLVIGSIWVIVVYCPLAYWVWGANGWLLNLGALDFAGGGPVHIASGVASFAYSWYIGPRGQPGKRTGSIPQYRGHSQVSMFIGVTLIWAAWLCFNSGTMLSVNIRTGYIFANTILASCFASFFYVVTDKLLTGKFSVEAACEGVIVGLVNITPSCGFYWPWAAAFTSALNAIICRLLDPINKWTGVDDYSKSGVVHGIGGILGGIFTGIFANKTVAGYDGVTEILGGWVDHHYKQLGYELAAIAAIVSWTTVFSLIIYFIVDHIPGMKLRATPEEEELGMDLAEMAETLDEFGNDYEEFFKMYLKYKQQSSSESSVIEVLNGIEVVQQGGRSVEKMDV